MNARTIGLLLAVMSTFFYSLMDSGIKWSLETQNVTTVIFYTHVNFIIFVCVAVFVLATAGFSAIKLKVKWYIMLYRGTLTFINFYLAYIILQKLPLDIYYSIVFTVPTIASVLSVLLLKQKLSVIKIVALALGLLGVFIITNPLQTEFNTNYIKPILLTLALAVSVALAMISTKQFFSHYDNASLAFYVFLICASFGAGIEVISNNSFSGLINFNYNVGLAFAVAICCLLGFVFFIQAYKKVATHVLAPTEYLFIIWGIILGKALFNDNVKVATLIGVAIVIVSNILVFLENRETKNKPKKGQA